MNWMMTNAIVLREFSKHYKAYWREKNPQSSNNYSFITKFVLLSAKYMSAVLQNCIVLLLFIN